jgi:hypothetical protein
LVPEQILSVNSGQNCFIKLAPGPATNEELQAEAEFFVTAMESSIAVERHPICPFIGMQKQKHVAK